SAAHSKRRIGTMQKITIAALAALSLATFSSPASAETTSVSVPYADLDLTKPAGVAALEGRIAAAAKQICGKVEVRRVGDGADHQRCLRETAASVRVELAKLTGKRVLALSPRR